MITGTMKTVLAITPDKDLPNIIDLIIKYPSHIIKTTSPLVNMVISELDRQYARWNKGGING